MHHLVYSGIPDELRPKIWRELLKVSIQEVEEIQNFKQVYKDDIDYDESETLFVNILMLSEQTDCLAFKQIDEDVEKFSF